MLDRNRHPLLRLMYQYDDDVYEAKEQRKDRKHFSFDLKYRPFGIDNRKIDHEENVELLHVHYSMLGYNILLNINKCYRIFVDDFLSS